MQRSFVTLPEGPIQRDDHPAPLLYPGGLSRSRTSRLRPMGFLVPLVVAINTTLSAPASAQPFAVKDPALQACINDAIREQSWQSVTDVTALKCHNRKIQTLSGLTQFTHLQSLSLYYNQIEHIDASLPDSLETLNLARNTLTSVELGHLPHLTTLYLFSNKIHTLSLTQLPSLTKLKANDNGMTSFHYQALDALEKIYIFDNELENVDIHHLPAMTYMDCRQNPMPDDLYDEMDRLDTATILHDGNAEDW